MWVGVLAVGFFDLPSFEGESVFCVLDLVTVEG